ncbi:MAG: cysteine synthase family protein [Thermoplasmata archaeon]
MHASDPPAVGPAETIGRIRGPERTIGDDPLVRAIGDTPLLSLGRIVALRGGGFTLWAKAEYLNPTGSVKDRAALSIVRNALQTGRLAMGRTLVDASSGNTAVAYAMLGARLGFPVRLCVPRNAHPERVRRMETFGAEIVFTDAMDGSDGAQREARRLSMENPEMYYYPDQYNNAANPEAHYATTGPEIWRQTAGTITHFVAGVGTGGTISGVARYLKERDPAIRIIGVEPTGPLHGIEGLKHIPTALRPSTYGEQWVDATMRIETEVAIEMQRRLGREEGISAGRSAGAAVAASLEVGARNPGAVVVTILPDGAEPAPSEAGR